MQRFKSWDGVEIAYECWGDPGSTPPVFLHHGFVVDHRLNWVIPGVVKALTAAGRQVIALDARGHGSSDAPHDPERYGEPKMAKDLLALFDLIGASKLDLVGYSMGSVVSLLAATADARIERLVIGGVGAGIVELGGLDTRALPNGAVAAALTAADAASLTDPGTLAFRQLADAIGADRVALAAQASRVHQSPIALQSIRARTLVLAGTEDPLAVRPQLLAAAIQGARLQLVPGDHMAAVMDPGFAAAIVGFLSRAA